MIKVLKEKLSTVNRKLPVPEVTDLGPDGFYEFARAEADSDWGSLPQDGAQYEGLEDETR